MRTYWSSISGYKPFLTVSAYGTALGAPVANNGADYGPDTSGTTTSGVQEALNAAGVSGTRTVYLINDGRSFDIASQVLFPSYVSVLSHGAVLTNIGSLQYPFATANNAQFYKARISGLVLNGNNVNNCQCLTVYSVQRSVIDVLVQNATYGCAMLVQTSATPVESVLGNNTVFNRLRFQMDNISLNSSGSGGVALSLQGNASPVVPVTNNRFEGLFLTNVYGVGIQLVEYCDSNDFGTTVVSLVPNSASDPTNTPVGVIFNNGAPTANVGVYNNRFGKLAVDAFGFGTSYTAVTGVLFNNTYQNVISQFYTSPGPTTFPGTRINFGGSVSHFLRDMFSTTNTEYGTTHQYNMPVPTGP